MPGRDERRGAHEREVLEVVAHRREQQESDVDEPQDRQHEQRVVTEPEEHGSGWSSAQHPEGHEREDEDGERGEEERVPRREGHGGYTTATFTGRNAVWRYVASAQPAPPTFSASVRPDVVADIARVHWNQTVTRPKRSESAKNGATSSRSRRSTFPCRYRMIPSSTIGSMTVEVFARSAARKRSSEAAYAPRPPPARCRSHIRIDPV